MSKYRLSTLAAVGLGVLLASEAQAISLGEFEYRNSCAQCHGADGKGQGPVAAVLLNQPPDLTVLSKNNGGVFPVTDLYAVIEGSTRADVHGGDMPLWGNRYMSRTAAESPDAAPFTPAQSELYVRARILSLIEYISTIQTE